MDRTLVIRHRISRSYLVSVPRVVRLNRLVWTVRWFAAGQKHIPNHERSHHQIQARLREAKAKAKWKTETRETI